MEKEEKKTIEELNEELMGIKFKLSALASTEELINDLYIKQRELERKINNFEVGVVYEKVKNNYVYVEFNHAKFIGKCGSNTHEMWGFMDVDFKGFRIHKDYPYETRVEYADTLTLSYEKIDSYRVLTKEECKKKLSELIFDTIEL